MSGDIRITGGADPEVAAAIAAVVDQVIRNEAARDTGSPQDIGRSEWAKATQLSPAPEIRPRASTDDEAPGPPPAPG